MTSEIDKLKHFHVEDYSGTNGLLCNIVVLKVIKDEEK
mgnify:CR=1 FL=1